MTTKTVAERSILQLHRKMRSRRTRHTAHIPTTARTFQPQTRAHPIYRRNNSIPTPTGTLAEPATVAPKFGGHKGSLAATAPTFTSGIFALNPAFIASMNVFAITAYPVFVG